MTDLFGQPQNKPIRLSIADMAAAFGVSKAVISGFVEKGLVKPQRDDGSLQGRLWFVQPEQDMQAIAKNVPIQKIGGFLNHDGLPESVLQILRERQNRATTADLDSKAQQQLARARLKWQELKAGSKSLLFPEECQAILAGICSIFNGIARTLRRAGPEIAALAMENDRPGLTAVARNTAAFAAQKAKQPPKSGDFFCHKTKPDHKWPVKPALFTGRIRPVFFGDSIPLAALCRKSGLSLPVIEQLIAAGLIEVSAMTPANGGGFVLTKPEQVETALAESVSILHLQTILDRGKVEPSALAIAAQRLAESSAFDIDSADQMLLAVAATDEFKCMVMEKKLIPVKPFNKMCFILTNIASELIANYTDSPAMFHQIAQISGTKAVTAEISRLCEEAANRFAAICNQFSAEYSEELK